MKKRMIGVEEAALETGISKWELRTGCRSGKYPHFRVGGARGKIIFDVELLNEHIRNMMLDNIKTEEISYERIRKIR